MASGITWRRAGHLCWIGSIYSVGKSIEGRASSRRHRPRYNRPSSLAESHRQLPRYRCPSRLVAVAELLVCTSFRKILLKHCHERSISDIVVTVVGLAEARRLPKHPYRRMRGELGAGACGAAGGKVGGVSTLALWVGDSSIAVKTSMIAVHSIPPRSAAGFASTAGSASTVAIFFTFVEAAILCWLELLVRRRQRP
jgi:hypothetical protein